MEFPAAKGRLPPGFRFHPTDVELLMHYLKRKLLGKRLEPELVADVDIYQFHPADLRERACLNKDLNWYFFCARGRKYGSGDRTNRSTQSGYWKATGKDRAVLYRERTVGKVKTLVFHLGKPPKGERTDWVMHEYRLEDAELANKGLSDAFVLCKIFKKGGWGPRNGEQYGAPYNEEEWNMEEEVPNDPPTTPVAASGVTNPAMILISPPEQIHSCDVSVSGVDQAPTPTSNPANVASPSKAAVPDHDAIPKDPVLNYADDVWCVDDFRGLYDNFGDVVPNHVDAMWCAPAAADFGGKCDEFEDLGMELDELMELLGP